jgi:hypothetical protein
MNDIVAEAVAILRRTRTPLEPGLTDAELNAVEYRFGFEFNPDHRAFLRAVRPAGKGWVDWRTAHPSDPVMSWPLTGMLFDVAHDSFWPASWGAKPADPLAAEAVARTRYAMLPRLVPIYLHRYLPAAPAPAGSPVLSVYQTDVIHYGSNLANYLAREFAGSREERPGSGAITYHVPFWGDLAMNADDDEL